MLSGLFKSVTSAVGLSPQAPKFGVPSALPNITATTGAALAEKAGLQMPAGTSLAPMGAPAGLIDELLNHNQDMLGATKVIAHGLPQRDGVRWAVTACRKIENKLPPKHREAIDAADAFATTPNAANRARAAAASESAGLQSPAGIAAKAASMADVPDAPAIPGGDQLVPTCVVGAVAGAVALSPKAAKFTETLPDPKAATPQVELTQVAMPPPPGPGSPESARNTIAFKPFIDDGLALAAGKK
jgi:hypothetical protein